MNKMTVRWGVFVPMFLIMGVAVLIGLIDNNLLIQISKAIFDWALNSFGWLYQWVSLISLLLVSIILCSKLGKKKIGERCKT